jgi:hypothetical protein
VAVAFGAFASVAAAHVNIVRQGEPPSSVPPGTHYYKTIQEAVNASTAGDYVLIEPGTYDEEVKVTGPHSGIWIRGLNRNKVIVDGQGKVGNGIDIEKANNVWVENLTVRNFQFGEGCPDEECGNEIWWNGGAGSGKVGAHGWFGSYLTAYDTGLTGGYGIFTGNETEGSWKNIYASGFSDSGMYIGACQECDASVTGAVMEKNALGYSGSNSGGKLTIEGSVFRNNASGVVPNSEYRGDFPPPQDGECGRENTEKPNPMPEIKSTKIARCTVIRHNVISENNSLTVPVNSTTGEAAYGTGIILPGDYADLITENVIANNANTGVFGIEFGFWPETESFFQLAGNRISRNVFAHNGYTGGEFTGDVTLVSGANEEILPALGLNPKPSESVNNCVSENVLPDATTPANIQGTWGCQHETTPNPGGGLAAYLYVERANREAAEKRVQTPQAAPPPQPTMPNPCAGVPKNPLCQ